MYVAKRNLLEYKKQPGKILLRSFDLPPDNPYYLKEITESMYKKEFDETIKMLKMDNYRRLVTVLPLYTNRNTVVPLPCVVDTGAPRMLYLGSAALNILDALHCIATDISHGWDQLAGKTCWNGNTVHRPLVEQLPVQHDISGEVRANLIGLLLMEKLSMLDVQQLPLLASK